MMFCSHLEVLAFYSSYPKQLLRPTLLMLLVYCNAAVAREWSPKLKYVHWTDLHLRASDSHIKVSGRPLRHWGTFIHSWLATNLAKAKHRTRARPNKATTFRQWNLSSSFRLLQYRAYSSTNQYLFTPGQHCIV